MKTRSAVPSRRQMLLLGAAALSAAVIPGYGVADDNDTHDDYDENRIYDESRTTRFELAHTGLKGRVVVIGGGMAGATAAKYLRLWGGAELQVTLVEPRPVYTSNIMSNLVLNNSRSLSSLDFGYSDLGTKYGVVMRSAAVTSLDTAARQVKLSDGSTLAYDRLVLAPGVEFMGAYGLSSADYDRKTPHAWSAGAQTALLRKFEQRQRLARAGRIADRGITIEIGGDARSRHIPAFQRPFGVTAQLGLFWKPGIAQQKACIVIEQEAIRPGQLLPSRHRLGHRTGRQGSLGGPGAVPVSPVLRDCGYRSHCQACQQQSKCRANHAGHSWQRLLIRR